MCYKKTSSVNSPNKAIELTGYGCKIMHEDHFTNYSSNCSFHLPTDYFMLCALYNQGLGLVLLFIRFIFVCIYFGKGKFVYFI